jgi:octaprenyl-diphosphate synthase
LAASSDPVRPELLSVVDLIAEHLKCADEFVAPLMKHIAVSSGGMTRPSLVLLSGRCFGRLNASHIKIAAVVEMIHTATLLHDDVIDHAAMRRGTDSVNSLWGNECAVLAGDCLLARAFGVSGELQSIQINRLLADSAQAMCRGELKQNLLRGKWDITEEVYRKVVEDKTAQFFSACCALGAVVSKVSGSRMQSLAGFGLNFGMAFQHVDDLLDIIGEETTTRKAGGSDLANGKPTLAFIRMLEKTDVRKKSAVFKELSDNEQPAAAFLERLKETGSLRYVFDTAARYVERAVAHLRQIDECSARASLVETARSITARVDQSRLS